MATTRWNRVWSIIRQDPYNSSTTDFAKATGVGREALFRWKKGTRKPSAVALEKIAKATGRRLRWLLDGELPEFEGATISRTNLLGELRAHLIAELSGALSVPTDYVNSVLEPSDEIMRKLIVQYRGVVESGLKTRLIAARLLIVAEVRRRTESGELPGADGVRVIDEMHRLAGMAGEPTGHATPIGKLASATVAGTMIFAPFEGALEVHKQRHKK